MQGISFENLSTHMNSMSNITRNHASLPPLQKNYSENCSPSLFDMTIILSRYFFLPQKGFPCSSNFDKDGHDLTAQDRSYILDRSLFDAKNCVILDRTASSEISVKLFPATFSTDNDPCNKVAIYNPTKYLPWICTINCMVVKGNNFNRKKIKLMTWSPMFPCVLCFIHRGTPVNSVSYHYLEKCDPF